MRFYQIINHYIFVFFYSLNCHFIKKKKVFLLDCVIPAPYYVLLQQLLDDVDDVGHIDFVDETVD